VLRAWPYQCQTAKGIEVNEESSYEICEELAHLRYVFVHSLRNMYWSICSLNALVWVGGLYSPFIPFCPPVTERSGGLYFNSCIRTRYMSQLNILSQHSKIFLSHREDRNPWGGLLRSVLIRISASPNHGLRMARPSGQWDCLLAENLIC